MKKLFLFLAIYGGLLSTARAANTVPQGTPSVNSYVSEAVYISSHLPTTLSLNTAIATGTLGMPTILHTVSVNSTGGSGARFEFYNAVDTSNVANRIASINTSSIATTYTYDVYLSSGLSAYNFATSSSSLADITISYRAK